MNDDPIPEPILDPRPFDPKLRQAMEEIKAVFAKYDIGGYTYLGSQTHGEYFYALTPSWSLITEEPVPNEPNSYMVRFKTTGLPKTPETDELIRNSVGLVAGIQQSVGIAYMQFEKLLNMLGEHMDFKHVSKHSPPDAV